MSCSTSTSAQSDKERRCFALQSPATRPRQSQGPSGACCAPPVRPVSPPGTPPPAPTVGRRTQSPALRCCQPHARPPPAASTPPLPHSPVSRAPGQAERPPADGHGERRRRGRAATRLTLAPPARRPQTGRAASAADEPAGPLAAAEPPKEGGPWGRARQQVRGWRPPPPRGPCAGATCSAGGDSGAAAPRGCAAPRVGRRPRCARGGGGGARSAG
mmetsp:Transcript_5729/g.18228  ORF Transcript_5729/g.18228 Transcript_5729/m.18228 type:complete len:216 (-) Transcript_5729:966-1613(-)